MDTSRIFVMKSFEMVRPHSKSELYTLVAVHTHTHKGWDVEEGPLAFWLLALIFIGKLIYFVFLRHFFTDVKTYFRIPLYLLGWLCCFVLCFFI